MKGRLTSGVLLRSFLRSYGINAAYNSQGLQNVGFLFAIEPGLLSLYGEGPGLAAARARYVRHFNCHPFFVPMVLGMFLRMEEDIVSGRSRQESLTGVKDTVANALSALGDSFFSGSLLGNWVLICSCLIAGGWPTAAGLLTLGLFVCLQCFKFALFILGVQRGLEAYFQLARFDLSNWGDTIKCVNAVFLTLFLILVSPATSTVSWGAMSLFLFSAGWAVGRAHMPRLVLAFVAALSAMVLPLGRYFDVITSLLS